MTFVNSDLIYIRQFIFTLSDFHIRYAAKIGFFSSFQNFLKSVSFFLLKAARVTTSESTSFFISCFLTGTPNYRATEFLQSSSSEPISIQLTSFTSLQMFYFSNVSHFSKITSFLCTSSFSFALFMLSSTYKMLDLSPS